MRRRKSHPELETKERAIREKADPSAICVNCGERGPHFAPPSFGAEGIFICDALTL
jgi:hypothetical protein